VSQRDPAEPIDGPLLPAVDEQARLRQLRETLLGTLNFNLDLRAEKETYDRDLEQLRSVVAPFNGPPSADDEILPFSIIRGAKDTKSDATFVASQLALVRNLIEEVKPRHEALLVEKRRAAASDGDEGTLGPDAQRKQYIETMTRKHMEITRNVKLNARGGLAGDSEAEGAKKDSDQVQRLDAIAGRWARGNGR
jgi:kinetochore protein Mis12/MTW1